LTPMRDQITVAETCRRYGISADVLRLSTSPLRRRCRGVGALVTAAAEVTGPNSGGTRGRDRKVTYGQPALDARSIHAHLRRSGAPTVPAVSTIHRVLQRNSLITPRAQRRAVPAWRRFERYAPNDLWQIDGTQVALTDGSPAWVIDILDDHARCACHRRPTVHRHCCVAGHGTRYC